MEYTVESLLDKRIMNGRLFYKVKWQGYPLEQSTWEPIEHLDQVLQMVSDFEAQQQDDGEVFLKIREMRIDYRRNKIKFLVDAKNSRGRASKWVEFYQLKESNPQLVCDHLIAYIQRKNL